MLDHRWPHNPPTYQRTVTPNWYRTHTVPEFGLLGSWVTGACHYTWPKQHDTAECLICQIDYKLSDEATASKVLRKINSKLKLLYCQSTFLTHSFRRLLCNALIQPHFDLSTSLMVSSFKEKFKNQTTKAVLKNMYSFLPKFTSKILIYQFIAVQKNHVTFSRTLYYKYRF